jgi:hypothetical protein
VTILSLEPFRVERSSTAPIGRGGTLVPARPLGRAALRETLSILVPVAEMQKIAPADFDHSPVLAIASCVSLGHQCGRVTASSFVSGRTYRRSAAKKWPGSSIIGRCAEFSNQTMDFPGALSLLVHASASEAVAV